MTVLALPQPGTAPRQAPLDVEIVIPVYNEAPHLAERVTELRRFLDPVSYTHLEHALGVAYATGVAVLGAAIITTPESIEIV